MTPEERIKTAQRLAWVRRLVRDGQLRPTLKAAGLTGGDLAVFVGVSPQTTYTWTMSPPIRIPSREVALRIAEVLEAVGVNRR